ncbi:hypothetical protein IGB42_03222 [Andreprevotia sp. IGB-42]|uniref:riboflavin biosynthesis protein RibA n=1 Tax=Andreprevotia sp. IGB-42 TaxID=2497473 RepID=UPI0013594E9A|nr:riboflavin biosynthesis protein RibA [Andreprevotia sp. IGB-42]KAF0812232.1 hypothetical protein IGB42_03222 [Andreprevotia sp. IGB-42]
MLGELISGEEARTKIAAVFDNEASATAAAEQVRQATQAEGAQVQLITPTDQHYGRKLEPESNGIVRTAIRAHATLGAVGLVMGLLLFGLLYAADLPAIVSSPLAAGMMIGVLGMVFGLLGGGLATMRPDHAAVITPVRDAVQHGQWAVVVHPTSSQQCDAAMRVLGNITHGKVMRTA